MKFLAAFVLMCAVANGVRDFMDWYHDNPAHMTTWFAAILFHVGVVISTLETLFGEEK